MRKASKILFILLIIFTVISVGFNILFLTSSSTVMIFNNNESARSNTFNTAIEEIETAKRITIKTQQPHASGPNNYSINTISCYLDEELNIPEYACEQTSIVYNENNEIIKEGYFPGDNYMYVIEGGNKSKQQYPNVALTQGLFVNAKKNVTEPLKALLNVREKDTNNEKDIFDFEISFVFSTFSLSKSITHKNTLNDTKQTLLFDSMDQLVSYKNEKEKLYIEIKYDITDLEHPVLDTFN